MRLGVFALIAFFWLFGLTSAFAQINKTWNGSINADWFQPSNWTPAGVPATNDTINFDSGTIDFTAPVTVYGQFNWSGGVLIGNPLTVATNGLLSLSGSGDKRFANVLSNAGTVTWAGSGALFELNDNASLKGALYNLAGGVFDIQNDSPLSQFGGFGFFNNAGMLRKSAGAGATAFFLTLTNSGAVLVRQGTLALYGGFNPANGALEFGLSGLNSFGKLTISGDAKLGGAVGVVWLGGYVPTLGDSFAVVNYDSRSEVFASLDLPSEALWQTNYGPTTFTLTVVNINKLVFSAAPSGTNAGAILAPPTVVQILDLNGNPLANSGVPVTLALGSGTGTLSGTLTQLTDATGQATFNDLSIHQAGAKTLLASASAAGLTPATTGSFIISPAAAAQLALAVPILSPQAAGLAFSPGPVVRVADAFGNTVLNSTVLVTARLSSRAGGSLSGTTDANADGTSGLAAFGNLGYNLANPIAAESVVAYFTSPGLTPVTNSAVSVDFVFSVITLQDKNSVMKIDPRTERGMFSWAVDDTNQAYQHWFWLGVDRFGAERGVQTSVDRLSLPLGLTSRSNNAVIYYFVQEMSVAIEFTLSGGAPGSQASDLAETLTVQNLTNAPITLHLFEYSDFDLGDSSDFDVLSLTSALTMMQRGKGMELTATVQAPTPNHWEAGFYAITLNNLNGGAPVSLSDSFIPQAQGDQTYAWQWDVTLRAGQTAVISLTKALRPISIELNIARSGADVVISWPTNGATGFRLQSASLLSTEAGWTTVADLPSIQGELFQVTLPRSLGTRSYRLQK